MQNPLAPPNRTCAPSVVKTNKVKKVVVGHANRKVRLRNGFNNARMNLKKPKRVIWDPGIDEKWLKKATAWREPNSDALTRTNRGKLCCGEKIIP